MLPAFLECVPCIFSQLVDVAYFNQLDDQQAMSLLNSAMQKMQNYDLLNGSAPEITAVIHADIRKQINNNDLYYQAKRDSNKLAMSLIPRVEQLIQNKDPLENLIKMVIAGNVMDYGTRVRFDIQETVENILQQEPAINDFVKLAQDLKSTPKKILYIGDNAGEIVFDKLLIDYLQREFQHQIIFLVKSEPILNDVLLEDALEVGLDKLVEVKESGSTTPGTLYKQMTAEIQELYHSVDFVIAKGQGNFETLPRNLTKTYFLLKMKCPKIAELLGVQVGDLIIQQAG